MALDMFVIIVVLGNVCNLKWWMFKNFHFPWKNSKRILELIQLSGIELILSCQYNAAQIDRRLLQISIFSIQSSVNFIRNLNAAIFWWLPSLDGYFIY